MVRACEEKRRGEEWMLQIEVVLLFSHHFVMLCTQYDTYLVKKVERQFKIEISIPLYYQTLIQQHIRK